MSSPLGDSEAVTRMARVYEYAADEIRNVGNETMNELLKAEFESPEATKLAAAAADRRGRCNAQAEELRDIAQKLKAHAIWIEETTEAMERLEQRIRAWARANPPAVEGTVPGPTASLITGYPESGSLEWEDLAARLRSRGATF